MKLDMDGMGDKGRMYDATNNDRECLWRLLTHVQKKEKKEN